MLDMIRGRAPNGKPPEPDARADLRQAQQHVGQAKTAAQRADEAAERAQAALTRARHAVSVYGDVDTDVARFRASDVRAGGTGAGPLPNELSTRRLKQQRATEEASDAERTAALIEREASQARAALASAEADLRVVVERIMQTEAAAVVARVRERELAVAADRVLLNSFVSIRTLSDPPVPFVQATTKEAAHQPLLDVAKMAGLPSGEPAWRDLRARLAADPDATLGGGNG